MYSVQALPLRTTGSVQGFGLGTCRPTRLLQENARQDDQSCTLLSSTRANQIVRMNSLWTVFDARSAVLEATALYPQS